MLVPAFFYTLFWVSIRWTLSTCPKGVYLRVDRFINFLWLVTWGSCVILEMYYLSAAKEFVAILHLRKFFWIPSQILNIIFICRTTFILPITCRCITLKWNFEIHWTVPSQWVSPMLIYWIALNYPVGNAPKLWVYRAGWETVLAKTKI